MRSKFLIYSILILLCTAAASGQTISRYNTFSYNVNEGLLQSTIVDMAFDKNNFCWISFPNGIQKFDGNSFISVPIQPGLPDDKLAYFFQCNNGELLIAHSQGISKYDISRNKFVQVYTNPPAQKKAIVFIGEDEDMFYFFNNKGMIIGIDLHTFKITSEAKIDLRNDQNNIDLRPKVSNNIINHRVSFNVSSCLYLWDLKKKMMISKSAPIEGMSSYFVFMRSENEVIYYHYQITNALQIYNFSTNATISLPIAGKDARSISRCNILAWQNKRLLFFNNNIFEAGSDLRSLGSELVNFQNQPIAGNATIANIKEDHFGNLFVQTVTMGIRKMIRNNYPIKYFGTGTKEENVTLSILPDKKNNRILVGTSGNGLLVFDTMQHLIKHIKTLPGQKAGFYPNGIIKNNNGDYLLFIVGEKKGWILNKYLFQLSPVKLATSLPDEKSGMHYFGNFLFQDAKKAIVQTQGRLYKTDLATNTINEHQFSTSYVMGGLMFNNKIITHANDELIFLDAETFEELKKIPFKNTSYVRCFVKDKNDIIYIGSNNGIFKIDSTGKILAHLKKINGLPDDCIYAMAFDSDGLLWCSTNKGIFKLNKDNSILQIKKDDGLQENEFNTNVVARSDDGELFFGGVNGVSSFYPRSINSITEKIKLLITKIRVNNEELFKDTALELLKKIIVPYNQNSLSFDFIVTGPDNPNRYVYQYKMKGVDDNWILNDGIQTVRYFLSPGTYTLQVYASRSFDKDAQAMIELTIVIRPPFWKAWWFIGLLGLLLIGILIFSINRYNKIKYSKKLSILENERQIKQERERISRDLHDSLGGYANAILYNTELLEEEKDVTKTPGLLKGLKFASKDIITSLRETVWALSKENYTAEDCLLRIRNFIQPFGRYYNNINFTVEGEAPKNKNFHYTRALNLVRMIQEAVTNSLKHAEAKNITVHSSDSDDRWILTISDDGKGFEHSNAKKEGIGNGLNNMQRRATDSGFEFYINSEKEKGTTVTIIA